MCVRVITSPSTNEGIRNPGLLQCFNGKHTCNDPKYGVPMLNPCPTQQINGKYLQTFSPLKTREV